MPGAVYDAADQSIGWSDGLHRELFSKTRVFRRSNGAPALSLTANRRFYGCFLSSAATAASGPSRSETSDPAITPAARRYSREEFLIRGREAAKAYENGDLKRAQTMFEDLVEANPDSADAQAALGAVLVRTGKDDDALVHLDRALRLNPRELSAYVNRGEVYLRSGRKQEAEADFKRAIALDPAGKNASANRARSLLRSALSR